MTVQLTTRPVLSQPEAGGWCRTAVFSESPQAISPENQPVWLVTVAVEAGGFEEKGIGLLNAVEQTYHSLELKSAEALFQTLTQVVQAEEAISLTAVCITLTTVTIMTKNRSAAYLWRGGQLHTIISNSTNNWQAVEGSWQCEDIWWIEAGEGTEPIQPPNNKALEDVFGGWGEEIAGRMNQEKGSKAGLLVRLAEAGPPAETDEVVSPELPQLSREETATRLKKRRVLALGWLVLILLVVSVFFGSKARQKRLVEQQYNSLSTQVEQSIAVVNALYQSDQVKAREQMRMTVSTLEAAQKTFKKDASWQAKWQALYDKANQTYLTISGEKSLGDVPVWYPLSTVKTEFSGNQMIVCGDNLVVWDNTTSTMVKIGMENKRNDIVAGGTELAGFKHMACEDNRVLVLANAGVIDISLTKRSTKTLIETDPEWQQPVLVGLFNNNVYVVDTGSQLIWRYPAITGGVGAKQQWFGQGVTLNGTDYVRLAIDGQLWLLRTSGAVSRYTRGAPQSFSLTGLDQPLGTQTPSFTVDSEQDRVAIVDSDRSRIVITTKNGDYTKQVAWPGLATAVDIAFSPNKDTLFVLNNGAIYAIDY